MIHNRKIWVACILALSFAAGFSFFDTAQATHQYFCTDAYYADRECTTTPTFFQEPEEFCADGDFTSQCTPVWGNPDTANLFNKVSCAQSATCDHVTATLSVSKSGTGTGTVASTGIEGINCGTICSYAFILGEKVTLTASPASGSTFGGWTNCPASGANPLQCVVPMDSDKNVAARFDAASPPPDTSDTETTTQTVSPGDTVTTDTSGTGPSPSDPIETSVTSPTGGQVTIEERPTATSAPPGFSFIAREVGVTAPPAPPNNPIILSFQLHRTFVPAAANPNVIRVFKDRIPIATSCPSGNNPCVASITVSGNAITIIVRAPSASVWNFAFPEAVAATGLVPCGSPGLPDCQLCHLFKLGNNVVTFLLVPSSFNGGFAIVLLGAVLLFAWGGFVWLSAMGSPARIQQAQHILLATIVGLLIIYGAWLFISLLLEVVGVASWTDLGTWWEIQCPLPEPLP